jgi:hypothetical protein
MRSSPQRPDRPLAGNRQLMPGRGLSERATHGDAPLWNLRIPLVRKGIRRICVNACQGDRAVKRANKAIDLTTANSA